MNAIKMLFGSHIYGTSTPASDLDYKAVYLPSGKDILLQRVKGTIIQNSKVLATARNQPGDVDIESFSLQQYIKLLLDGQTVAIDMLFAPSSFYQGDPHWTWVEIQKNRHRFLHKKYVSFAGYCRQQANKYGIKGSRMKAVRVTLEWLKGFDQNQKLIEIGVDNISAFVQTIEHAAVVDCRTPRGVPEPHLEVCNRKIPFHSKIKFAIEVYQRIFDEYGARALQAEKSEGVDWKALMHAVRICNQSKELLLTGHVEFPRPEREYLVKIRTGQVPYAEVATLIENGLEEMIEHSAKSSLPDEPDYEWAEDLVYRAYAERVRIDVPGLKSEQ